MGIGRAGVYPWVDGKERFAGGYRRRCGGMGNWVRSDGIGDGISPDGKDGKLKNFFAVAHEFGARFSEVVEEAGFQAAANFGGAGIGVLAEDFQRRFLSFGFFGGFFEDFDVDVVKAVYAPDGVDHKIDEDLFGVVDGLEFVVIGDSEFFEFVGVFDGEQGAVGEETVFGGVLGGAGFAFGSAGARGALGVFAIRGDLIVGSHANCLTDTNREGDI